jgi:hypothetical protein
MLVRQMSSEVANVFLVKLLASGGAPRDTRNSQRFSMWTQGAGPSFRAADIVVQKVAEPGTIPPLEVRLAPFSSVQFPASDAGNPKVQRDSPYNRTSRLEPTSQITSSWWNTTRVRGETCLSVQFRGECPQCIGAACAKHTLLCIRLCTCVCRRGWGVPTIKPFGPILMHPASQVLHYGTCCFEGMKAYHGADGRGRLFRWASFDRQTFLCPERCIAFRLALLCSYIHSQFFESSSDPPLFATSRRMLSQ